MNYYTKTILCVDDDADDFLILQEALNNIETGYDIVSAKDGVHALELLQEMKLTGRLPCLIVLDINMPRMDGKETLAAIQKDRGLCSIPIVLYTTSSSALDKAFSLLKHVELITKPFTVKTLHAVALKLLQYCDGHAANQTVDIKKEMLLEG